MGAIPFSGATTANPNPLPVTRCEACADAHNPSARAQAARARRTGWITRPTLRLPIRHPVAEDANGTGDDRCGFEPANPIAATIMALLSIDDERVQWRDTRTGRTRMIDVEGVAGSIDERAGIDRGQVAIGKVCDARSWRAGDAAGELLIEGNAGRSTRLNAACDDCRKNQKRKSRRRRKIFSRRQRMHSSLYPAGQFSRSA